MNSTAQPSRHTRADPEERPHHQRALDSLIDLLAQVLRPGWTGEAALVLQVHDGHLRGTHHRTDRKVP